MTHGNYQVHRVLTYPDYANSEVVFDTQVTAVSEKEWSTTIVISGKYDGPTDSIAVRDYHMTWSTDGKTLSEQGEATLERASGGTVRTAWSSTFTPKEPTFTDFPSEGETVNVTFSSMKVEGDTLTYDWQGTVSAAK